MNVYSYGVYYEDTDAGGVVYYANYLKFLERARTDFLKSLGVLQSNLLKENIFFVVKKCNVEYISSSKLDDELKVSCVVLRLGRAGVEFLQEVFANEQVVVKAMVKIACVAKKQGKFVVKKIPDDVLFKLKNKSLEK